MATVAELVIPDLTHFNEAALSPKGQRRHNLTLVFEDVVDELDYVFRKRFIFTQDGTRRIPDPPGHWDRYGIPVTKETHAAVYYSQATNPIGVIGFPMGFKAHPSYLASQIEILNAEGFSVMPVMPPYPGRREDFIETYKHVMNEAVFNPNSIFYTHDDPGLPRIIAPHSAGGLTYLLQKAAIEPERARIIADRLAGVIQMGLFLDTANSSEIQAPLISRIYEAHAWLHSQSRCGQPWLDRRYMDNDMLGRSHSTSYEPPTHGQALALRKLGREYLHSMDKRVTNALDAVPEVVFTGQPHKDKSACVPTASVYASKAGAYHHMTDAGHNPIKESWLAFEVFRRFAHSMAEAHRQHKRFNPDPLFGLAEPAPQAALALESAEHAL